MNNETLYDPTQGGTESPPDDEEEYPESGLDEYEEQLELTRLILNDDTNKS